MQCNAWSLLDNSFNYEWLWSSLVAISHVVNSTRSFHHLNERISRLKLGLTNIWNSWNHLSSTGIGSKKRDLLLQFQTTTHSSIFVFEIRLDQCLMSSVFTTSRFKPGHLNIIEGGSPLAQKNPITSASYEQLRNWTKIALASTDVRTPFCCQSSPVSDLRVGIWDNTTTVLYVSFLH